MGLQLPSRVAAPAKRVATGAVLGLALVTLGACSAEDNEFTRLAMPEPASEQAPHILNLWQGAWVAALAVGVITWGLILYTAWRFRRRSNNDVPVQTRYNLPLEIFYTIAPIMMVIVFFYWTVNVQNEVIDLSDDPDVTVDVVGQQWSWTFNYTEQGDGGTTPYTVGTPADNPVLVVPVDQVVQFNLQSPDVIHSFGIPAFLMRMDVVPGRINKWQVTPSEIGTYRGKCVEFCGTSHSRMLFDVQVVSQERYASYLDELQAAGSVADEPLLGGSESVTQEGLKIVDETEEAGLAEDDNEEGGQQ